MGGVCLCVCVVVQILKNNQNVGSEVSDASNLTLTACLTFLTPANDIHTYGYVCHMYHGQCARMM